MNSVTEKHRTRRFTGWHFLIFIIGFFAVVITANVTMAYFALDTFSGLETEDAYRKGRDYNVTLQAAKRQEALGWQEKISLVKNGKGANASHHITLTLRGAETETDLKATLLVRRPATDVDDQLITLVETTPATFEGVVKSLDVGRWKLSLEVNKKDAVVFRKNSEFVVTDE